MAYRCRRGVQRSRQQGIYYPREHCGERRPWVWCPSTRNKNCAIKCHDSVPPVVMPGPVMTWAHSLHYSWAPLQRWRGTPPHWPNHPLAPAVCQPLDRSRRGGFITGDAWEGYLTALVPYHHIIIVLYSYMVLSDPDPSFTAPFSQSDLFNREGVYNNPKRKT